MQGLFKLKSVLAVCVSAALTACHPSVDSVSASFASADAAAPQPTLREQIAQLEKSGQIPSLDRTNTLLGIDANNNGVRDDIEAYINRLGFTPAQVRAAMQKAKILQQTLTVNTNDPVAVQQLGEKSMASTKCLGDSFIIDGQRSQVSQMLESNTMNTKLRVMQYLKYNAARSGSVTRYPSGDTCEK